MSIKSEKTKSKGPKKKETIKETVKIVAIVLMALFFICDELRPVEKVDGIVDSCYIKHSMDREYGSSSYFYGYVTYEYGEDLFEKEYTSFDKYVKEGDPVTVVLYKSNGKVKRSIKKKR